MASGSGGARVHVDSRMREHVDPRGPEDARGWVADASVRGRGGSSLGVTGCRRFEPRMRGYRAGAVLTENVRMSGCRIFELKTRGHQAAGGSN